jgi:hypothetical protein
MGDNSLDEQGNGRFFCIVKRKWAAGNYSFRFRVDIFRICGADLK